ncbi:hypothetical protein J0H58_25895 [bacterium]|nr:hypothetical protein [bacterium]
MLPDDVLALLTAAVDGELTPAEVTTVRALLAGSDEARAAYKRLRADRQRLRRLTPAAPPADLHARIMARLPARPPVPVEVARPSAHPRRVSRAPIAVAASVLLAVTGGSFAFFMNQTSPTVPGHPTIVARADTKRDRDWERLLPRDTAPPPSAPAAIEGPIEGPVEPAPVAVSLPVAPEIAPSPRPVVRDVLTFPPLPEVGKLDLARVRVPFLATVAEFDREDVQQQFVNELGHDPAFRIDLFARDPGKGVELLQAAGKVTGLTIHADTMTRERVQRKLATAYLVYTDSLSATDLRDLLVRLAAADAKAPQRTFDAVHATPVTQTDQRELRDTLGTDPGLWKRPGTPTAEPKNVASGTADRIAKTLTDPPGKGGEKAALLMTFAPAQARTPPATSRELRQFLDRRGERRPAAVPVLIVIRQATG